jgi:hypothetical protein
VIVLSIPATESYQVTLSETFFNLDQDTINAMQGSASSTGTPTETPTPAPTRPLCTTSTTVTVLNSLPPEALRQFADTDRTCNRWVVACQKGLPCGEFVREVRHLVPDYTMDKFFDWNPDVKDDQTCSGFWQNYTYCVGQRVDAGEAVSLESNPSQSFSFLPYPPFSLNSA